MRPEDLSPTLHAAEQTILIGVGWLRLAMEILGAGVIAVGVAVALVGFLRGLGRGAEDSFHGVRLTLARYLALALELQLGADILATAIAPSWDSIGKLAAIAVIRTGLNLFLTHEVSTVRREQHQARCEDPKPSQPPRPEP